MIIIETCPKCGADLLESMIATFPPITRKECIACGWSWESEPEQVLRRPFNPINGSVSSQSEFVPWSDITIVDQFLRTDFRQPACQGCGCNPANGGSGICNCTLGQEVIS